MKTLLALLLLASPALADTLVLDVPGIPGDSTVLGFPDAIEVDQYGFHAFGFEGGSAATFSVTGRRDRSFPQMVLACLQGGVLGAVRMSMVGGDGVVRAELDLTSAVCVEARTSLEPGVFGTQTYSFEFSAADWQYYGATGKGKDDIDQPAPSTAPGGVSMTGLSAANVGSGGASGLFLTLGDIPGGATTAGFVGTVEVSQASWGVANYGGFRTFDHLTASGAFDPSFPEAHLKLLDDKALGAPVVLEAVSQGQTGFEIVLTTSKVRGADTFGADGELPGLHYSLDYETVVVTHTVLGPGGPTGTITVGWDVLNDTEL